MMLQLRFRVEDQERVVPLVGSEIRFGRAGDNDVVLPDYSVSRHHARMRREGDGWLVLDLQSTNGVQVNQVRVEQAPVRASDRLKIGAFEILVEEGDEKDRLILDDQMPTAIEDPIFAEVAEELHARQEAVEGRAAGDEKGAGGVKEANLGAAALSNATIIRSLDEFEVDFGFDERASVNESSVIRRVKRKALDEAYASQIFGFLTRLARLLIATDSDDEILRHVMDIAFEALPVDRGFILLLGGSRDELRCELMRKGQQVELRPRGPVPISTTMLKAVMRERVALLSFDALSDQRLAGTESVRIHQIRAAMCAPLWAGEKIIGVMQLDSPHHTGTFTEPDVDLLAALANYCAVAIERNSHAREAEFERRVRSRLERYHSPSVIEEVLQQDAAGGEAIRRLMRVEATVLFADIVGFTAFSEKAQPEEVAELLEGYFTHAAEAIFAAGGTLDKFIGDCVMAFFGAPVDQPDHACRAVEAAVRFSQALEGWNADRRRRGLIEIASRIGINTGPVVVGDIGSKRRVDYTVLGNTVNVAARLEEKVAAPGEIVVGDSTCRLLGDRYPMENLGELRLKGLSRPIVAHRILRS